MPKKLRKEALDYRAAREAGLIEEEEYETLELEINLLDSNKTELTETELQEEVEALVCMVKKMRNGK